ncbi:DUF2141 domain-containing protein [Haliscomenobacter hydrossis]|uniref:DUF2141 domain-containing protein n=1 Tax=Haliscomenobacter hydrossis (strain ATCC 27775 / DSM 1100 / LMG 10767 / O) TaxID=760192 RepID=F4KWI1_HALH1|nr:DUF2141 domain-containing protein [Haliscomenobacter hydrossis]AEE51321.1 Protein of unknown function DUF2141 [Haliscomenobacter hydrossis DSM 1100]
MGQAVSRRSKSINGFNMITCLLNLISLLWVMDQPAFSENLNGSTITVNITDVRNKKGSIRLSVFKDEASFSAEKASKTMLLNKNELTGGKMNTSVQLPSGTYGIAVLDDENSNEKMDYGVMMPKEGFGFSNFYLTGLRKPKFEKFKFLVSDANFSVVIRMKYM